MKDRAVSAQATDSALCSELAEPIDEAVDTTIDHSEATPGPVADAWARVVRGFDAGCNLK